jgi:hypothetical protein
MKNENTHVRCFESNPKTLDITAPVVFSVPLSEDIYATLMENLSGTALI